MSKSTGWPIKSLIAPTWLLLAIGILCLALPALVWGNIYSSPSDGARMSKLPEATTSQGIYIDVLAQHSLLQDGDLVVGVQGIPMAAWVEAMGQPHSWQRRWASGETITYQVVRQGSTNEVPVLLGSQPAAAILAENWSVLLFALVFQVIAIFIIIKKPKEPAAQALFIWGMTTSHFYLWSSFTQIYDFVSGSGYWMYTLAASFLWVSNWPASLHLALTFPTPLPTVTRHPWLAWALYPLSYAIYLLYLVASRAAMPSTLEWIGQWNRGDTLIALLMFPAAVVVILWQFRMHRHGPERRKVQWVLLSGLFSGTLAVSLYLLPEFLGLPGLGVNIVGILLLPFPVAIAIAIWRYQLFDINLIIHRTLVYGALTATLAVVFFGTVALLQAFVVLDTFTGKAGLRPLQFCLRSPLEDCTGEAREDLAKRRRQCQVLKYVYRKR